MKLSPADREREGRLRPSRLSAGGFMGIDSRTFDEIVADDGRRLEQAGLSHHEIAASLDDLYTRAQGELGVPLLLSDGSRAVYHEAKGTIPSPIAGDGRFDKGEVVVTLPSGDSVRLTRLGIHLIDRYGFFQGRGAPYRIEPSLVGTLVHKGKEGQ